VRKRRREPRWNDFCSTKAEHRGGFRAFGYFVIRIVPRQSAPRASGLVCGALVCASLDLRLEGFARRNYMDDPLNVSRRGVLRIGALVAGAGLAAAVLPVREALAQQKAPKESMKYQDRPNGQMQCSNCSQFVAPDGCKVVEGKISPNGYCIAWLKKA